MKRLMLGNEAVAHGVRDAGATVVSAYPGTPSTEITENIARFDDVYSEWAPNEKVAAEVAIGASIAGARSFCAMKHVGLNVAADPVFTASYTGVNGGLLITVADDPGMHSSQNEQDSRYYARSAHLPMLEPSDSQECYDFAREAYRISEEFDTPVVLRLTTRIAHSQSLVEQRERDGFQLKPYVKDFRKYVMMPGMARARHLVVEKRDIDLKKFADETGLNRVEMNDTKIGIICSGIAYQYAKEAFPNASFLKLGMVHPLPEKKIAGFAEKVENLIVVEELEPFFEEVIKRLGIPVLGKDRLTLQGELTPAMLRKNFADLAGTQAEEAAPALSAQEIPQRPPVMCPGCPHRGAFYVLKKLKLVVSGDIGCYTLGALPPNECMDACVCMGASVGMAHGMEKARGAEFAKNTVAVIGDSTFIHSGITGLIDIVYNKGVSTVIILDNSITGMTGHQDNPTTGFTIKGEPTKQVDLKKLCEAIGVTRVRICDPFDLKAFEQAVKEETAAPEPSVIISQRPCALLKRVKYGSAFEINSEKCKNCGSCLKIGCPAIVRKENGMMINDALCCGCGLCESLCAFGAISRRESR
ncbi:MAG TPA: indolepyruvate ferredoxin oxidoreductase subunit alpha [Clostridia bacterium]|nr:indolepyruvate ferredoxin oxidoreductase subunit alpha [Clostridia bacterium]